MGTVAIKLPDIETAEETPIDARTLKNTVIGYYLAQKYSVRKIRRLTGAGHATILKVKKGELMGSTGLLKHIKSKLASTLELAASTFIDEATKRDKLDGASTLQLVTATGISIDKARLLNNESTLNVDVRSVHQDVASSMDKLNRLLEDVR